MRKITDKELEKLEGLVGYGRPDAKTIFIGLEEKGGDYKSLYKRLEIDDYKYLDCRRTHLDIFNVKNLHNDNPKHPVDIQPVWGFMSYFMLRQKGYTNKEIRADKTQLLREYQNNYLGTTSDKGETLLAELYPLPCEKFRTWGSNKEPYDHIIPQYNNYAEQGFKEPKDLYKKSVIPKRKKILEDIINSDDFNASTIVCYGKANWLEFEKFFKLFGVEFKQMNTSKECKIGSIKDKVKVILTPFFGQGAIGYSTIDEIINEMNS